MYWTGSRGRMLSLLYVGTEPTSKALEISIDDTQQNLYFSLYIFNITSNNYKIIKILNPQKKAGKFFKYRIDYSWELHAQIIPKNPKRNISYIQVLSKFREAQLLGMRQPPDLNANDVQTLEPNSYHNNDSNLNCGTEIPYTITLKQLLEKSIATIYNKSLHVIFEPKIEMVFQVQLVYNCMKVGLQDVESDNLLFGKYYSTPVFINLSKTL